MIGSPTYINATTQTFLQSGYNPHRVVRALIPTPIILGLLAASYVGAAYLGALLSGKNFISICSDAASFAMRSLSWKVELGVGGGLLIWVSGTAAVFARTRQKKHNYVPGETVAPARYWGTDQWKPICRTTAGGDNKYGFIDLSRVDENGNGVALVYGPSDCHYLKSFIIGLSFPFQLVGAIVKNAIKGIITPFQASGNYLYEKGAACWTDEPYACFPEERSFKLIDIPVQVAYAIGRIVQAPFYLTAIQIANVYSMVDNKNGNALLSDLDEDWNNYVAVDRGTFTNTSSLIADQGPDSLRKAGAFFPVTRMPCKKPHRAIVFKDWKIVKNWSFPSGTWKLPGNESFLWQNPTTQMIEKIKLAPQSVID